MSNKSSLKKSDHNQSQLEQLSELLPTLWSRDTSGFPDQWSSENPSCGQCYCTSRLVRVLSGGDLYHQKLRFSDGVYDHFVNIIDGYRYDLSSAQMAGETFVVAEERLFSREEIESFERIPWIKRRVQLLFHAYTQLTGVEIPV